MTSCMKLCKEVFSLNIIQQPFILCWQVVPVISIDSTVFNETRMWRKVFCHLCRLSWLVICLNMQWHFQCN